MFCCNGVSTLKTKNRLAGVAADLCVQLQRNVYIKTSGPAHNNRTKRVVYYHEDAIIA